jgi:hypothetical protein
MGTRTQKAMQFLMGTVLSGLMITTGTASTLDFDPATLELIDELFLQMRQETIEEQFTTMPLRAEMPGRMMENMYLYASNTYRQSIQPQMVQSIISNLRPWDFPDHFKGVMMPLMVGHVSDQIKAQQVNFMQEGISDPSFPPIRPEGALSEKERQDRLVNNFLNFLAFPDFAR